MAHAALALRVRLQAIQDDAVLDVAVAELSAASLCRDSRANRQWLFAAYQRWCLQHGCCALPSAERDIVGYLHDVGRHWSAVHRRATALAIGWSNTQAGHPDPRGPELAAYLRAASARYGMRRQPPVHALSAEDIARMVFAAGRCSEQETLDRARNAVIRSAATSGALDWTRPRRPWQRLLSVPASSFSCHQTSVHVTLGTITVHIDEEADPLGYEALVELLHGASASGTVDAAGPAPGMSNSPLAFADAADAARFVALWRRVRRNWEQPDVVPTAAELRTWSDERWWWHQRLLPRCADRQLRDVAWLLVGWSLGARFADLHDAVVVTRTHDGQRHLRTVQHKTSRDGSDPLDMFVMHLSECGPLCPACALDDHLELQERRAAAGAPMFATSYGGPQRMTGANARLQLRAMWLASGGAEGVQVTTRSLRSGAAVTASERGAQIGEVQQLLRQADTRATRHYLRRRRPDLVEVHLDYS